VTSLHPLYKLSRISYIHLTILRVRLMNFAYWTVPLCTRLRLYWYNGQY